MSYDYNGIDCAGDTLRIKGRMNGYETQYEYIDIGNPDAVRIVASTMLVAADKMQANLREQRKTQLVNTRQQIQDLVQKAEDLERLIG